MSKGKLFDTSIWIDFLNGKNSEETRVLTRYLEKDLRVYICPVILQEVLQGIANDDHFASVRESFLALCMLTEDSIEAAIGAAEIYRFLRKKGITIRKSNDCLIAWYALKNSLDIVHNDRDFDLIRKHIKTLRF
ncbi:PIN domain-containing protein [Maribellus comscasis]|uniref:Ribonuclease VapC n=1 Tax=Maribellus comscasis TaxID=2681766 RepID=A0A6I6JV16_9BACT|nr:PIN domain nuclease [Maribellus comscasis]QGY44930.1 PIN domain-containing protein [Maribellus comscasis]